jgi:serine/threonine-protein kinase
MTIRDGANQDVWVYDMERDVMTPLTFGRGTFVSPVWSRDGRHVVVALSGVGMFWTRADGAGQPQALLGERFRMPTSISSDGTRLAFVQIDGIPQLWSVEVVANESGVKAGTPTRFLTTRSTDTEAVFSPDGRWLAYQSNESGRPEVYVRPFPAAPGTEERVQISNGGGFRPAWSPNGRELIYQSGGQIMTVSYATSGGHFAAGKPGVWGPVNVSGSTGFDIAPDGRLAVMMPAASRESPRPDHTIVFVQHFLDELRRRAPVDP